VRTAASAAGQPLGEGLTLEIFEHEEVDTALVADVVERADVRVIERRDRARLAVEALAQLRICGEGLGQHLDGDRPIEPRIARPIDLAHPAGADGADYFIGTEPHSGG